MAKRKKNPNYMINLPEFSTPRWVIILLDLIIFLFALAFAYLVRFEVYENWSVVNSEWKKLSKSLPFLILIKLTVFYLFKIHRGLIRHTSFEDIRRVFLAVCTTSILFYIGGMIRFHFVDETYLIPISVLLMEFFISLMFLIGFRFAIKVYYYETTKNRIKREKKIIVYGAGVSGLITKRSLERDQSVKYKIVALIDDNEKLAGNRLEGVQIFHSSKIENLIEDHEVEELIIAIQKPNKTNTSSVVEACLNLDVEVKSVPSFNSWINGEFSVKQIRKVKIEDLLGRKPIELGIDAIKKQIKGKNILISGAAGSIGSGIVRQVVGFEPKKIVLLDQSESGLYDLFNELFANKKADALEVVIGDIRNSARMDRLFDYLKPDLVFHAAAYKHVPLMEDNPTEAVNTNILGTKNLADLANKYKTKKFVMVSTDKAVNPTNVMGASKRIAELYVQHVNEKSTTQFVTTRFGNVLGSNGSVIPLFRRQIEQGGPITVTDPEVTRFFMTIPEACQLVLEAGAMGNGGEIFVFDMGESVKIIDLAKKMIKLSGLELGKDIEIKFTGLRPGEKLYEELLANDENTIPTHHPQILKAKQTTNAEDVFDKILELINLFDSQDNFMIVKQMKEIVPEFKSNNSVYTKLDRS